MSCNLPIGTLVEIVEGDINSCVECAFHDGKGCTIDSACMYREDDKNVWFKVVAATVEGG